MSRNQSDDVGRKGRRTKTNKHQIGWEAGFDGDGYVALLHTPAYRFCWLYGHEDDRGADDWEPIPFDTTDEVQTSLLEVMPRLMEDPFVVSTVCWDDVPGMAGYSAFISVPERFGLVDGQGNPLAFVTAKEAFTHIGEAIDQLRGCADHWEDMEIFAN